MLYHDRAAIEDGALEGQAPVIAWAADPVEFFFLQIQGSGRLRTPEGDVIRIGYAGQNGRGYTGIGGVMRERGLLGDGPGQYAGSMQGIMAYIRENPREGRDLMRLNKSWIFFSELTGDGPLGALGVPVRRESVGCRRSRFCAAGRAGMARHGPRRGGRALDCAGYWRRDQGRQPVRHLLGRGRRRAQDRRRHERARDGLAVSAEGHGRAP